MQKNDALFEFNAISEINLQNDKPSTLKFTVSKSFFVTPTQQKSWQKVQREISFQKFKNKSTMPMNIYLRLL